MIDYAKLAENAKLKEDVDRMAVERHKKLRADPCSFFERVKAHLMEEMDKANAELRKRKGSILGRNHLPGFDDEVFLTYGTDSLCRVGLGIMSGGCRITAIISGPPNGYELSRKEYICNQDEACQEVLPAGQGGLRIVAAGPDDVAADIIAGILVGKFN